MQPKFSIGQKVKFHLDSDSEIGEVLSYSFHPETGFTYQISAKEVDLEKKEIIQGIKHCREDELVEEELVEEKSE